MHSPFQSPKMLHFCFLLLFSQEIITYVTPLLHTTPKIQRFSSVNRNQKKTPQMVSWNGRTAYSDTLPFPARFAVLGGGSFGLASASVLARKNIPVTVLVRKEEIAQQINNEHTHPVYLKDIKLPSNIRATTNPAEALSDATYIIHAIPVQHSRKFLEDHRHMFPKSAPILSLSKGIETGSLCLMDDIMRETLGENGSYAYMSGPSFAREMALEQATAVVFASRDQQLAQDLAQVFSGPNFKCFTSQDVMGLEIGGAVKNVVALAAGMCDGLGLGTNAKAGLVTRGCAEMRRLASHMGGQASTISGLSGVGDAFATCFGPLSRNRNFGYRLGTGEKIEDILASMNEVSEGVQTSYALVDLIKKVDNSYRIDLKYPILFGVNRVLKGETTPAEGLSDLMAMPLRAENFEVFE
mmetsp:Transcript_38066/g.50151  ORF Transcript_38066/g.50151 Transcript_38066/m.50151 type:complete len:411 (+) Transcript_38066:320-1552(+)